MAGLCQKLASIISAFEKKSSGGFGNREIRERVFTVEVMDVKLGTEFPEIQTFGEVISGRTLELRAAASGELVQISDNFREGGYVREGEVLFQTNPAIAQSRLLISENELAEAEADLLDGRRNLSITNEEIKAAERQLELRIKAEERQERLRERGVGTETAMETAALATSSAEQAVLAKRLSLANAEAKIARAETLVRRRKINVNEATRILSEATVKAEFDGVLTGVSAVLGRLVNANEQLGSLIDPNALVPEFREVMNNTASGELSKPFKSPYGWHVLQVMGRRATDSSAQFREQQAANLLRNRKYDEELQAWLRQIRDEAYVETKL